MISRKVLRGLMVCLVLFLLVAFLADVAHAAKQDLSEKKGIEGLLSSKGDPDDPRIPSKAKQYIGMGSFVVMIIVVKYL
jgi:hypothetical protein